MATSETAYVELVPPKGFNEWGWPAIVNFTLGGIGAGYHALGFLFALWVDGAVVANGRTFWGSWVGPTLVTIGLMMLALESRRPSRSGYLMCHLRRSWISRELFCYGIFMVGVLADLVWPSFGIRLVSAAGAVGLLVSHGFIVFDALAVSAWNRANVLWVLICSAMASSAAGTLLLPPVTPFPFVSAVAIALTAITANGMAWLLYLYSRDNGDPVFRSVALKLRRPALMVAILGVGHLLPLVLIGWLLQLGLVETDLSAPLIPMALAALLVMFGTIAQRVSLLRTASIKRGIGFHYERLQPPDGKP